MTDPTAEPEADRFSSMSSGWYYSDTGATGRGSNSVMTKLKTESREAVLRILWICKFENQVSMILTAFSESNQDY